MTATMLRDVPNWDALEDLYGKVAHDDDARRLVLDEAKRRERAERDARSRNATRAEWHDAAYAQYLDADRVCRGVLVARGSRVTDAWQLWSGSDKFAYANCSEELANYWLDHPRVTVTAYRQQIADGHRIQADEAEAAALDNDHHETRDRETTMTEQTAAEALRADAYAARREQLGQECERRATEYGRQLAVREASAVVQPREPIDGDRLLRDTRKFLRYFALWPNEESLNVATLYAAAAHAKDPEEGVPIFEYMARLLFTAMEYGAGKSWFAKLTASLCPDGIALLEPTKPSIIDEIGMHKTVVITEVDELLATRGRNRGIVAVINGSYEPGHFHTRKRADKVEEIHVFGPMILDGVIDPRSSVRKDLRAICSRSFAIQVHMAPDGYRRPRWDKDAREHAKRGRDRLGAWMAQEVANGMEKDRPDMPADLGNPRRCAMWEALFMVALRADMCAAKRDGREDAPEMYWSKTIAASARVVEDALGLPYDEPEDEGQGESQMSDLDRALAEMED